MDGPLRVLELYSGIGGMHYALKENVVFKASQVNGQVIAAVDINPNASLVYKHNFKDANVIQKSIEGIKIEDYDKMNFDMLLMSPPCQPYTRQGKQQGACDSRSKSFLYLIELIPRLQKKPKYILMENVKGFDESTARDDFVSMLKAHKYSYQECLLSPIQFGIPNTRLRYFLIAKLTDQNEPIKETKLLCTLPEVAHKWIDEMYGTLRSSQNDEVLVDTLVDDRGTNESELIGSVKVGQLNNDHRRCAQSEIAYLFKDDVKSLNEFLDVKCDKSVEFKLSKDLFSKSITSADIVTRSATRTSCFTKNYGRFMEGTGSILLMNDSLEQGNRASEDIEINYKDVRFLSAKEIANLHCFPQDFAYPSDMNQIQRFRLIGNSLNVLIVAVLIKLLVNK